ncbi:MAG TPA: DNA-formamidopyrimidine glycosylase family protein [Myxococcota bacterium]|nr:DNA-formamidopyrimidine glycosylase family protein [Myxococcota bacterium]
MPELPEVEFCRRSLERWCGTRKFLGFTLLDPRCVRASTKARPSEGLAEGEAALADTFSAPPGELLRHGKRILWRFGDRALLLHLGMTGKWSRRPSPHAKIRVELADGPLYFVDPRLLGGVVPLTWQEGQTALRAGLGPDALGNPLPPLHGRRAVKVALMDQAVVAGLGNVQAMEALWRAGLRPTLPAEEVVGERHSNLDRAVQTQLRLSLGMLEGEEEITYVEEAGSTNPFPIYQRDGEPCPVCGSTLERLVQSGRSTVWCPRCQP